MKGHFLGFGLVFYYYIQVALVQRAGQSWLLEDYDIEVSNLKK